MKYIVTIQEHRIFTIDVEVEAESEEEAEDMDPCELVSGSTDEDWECTDIEKAFIFCVEETEEEQV